MAKWKWSVGALAFVGFGVGLLGGLRTGSAYNTQTNCSWPYSGGYSTLPITYKNLSGANPYGDYATAFAAARTSWLNTDTPTYFLESGSSSSVYSVAYLGGSNLGQTAMTQSGGVCQYASITLNASVLASGSYGHIFWKQFTAAHELGHHIRIGHVPGYNPAAIMMESAPLFPDDFRTATPPSGGWNGPMADDVCGVNNKYPSTGWPPTCGY